MLKLFQKKCQILVIFCKAGRQGSPNTWRRRRFSFCQGRSSGNSCFHQRGGRRLEGGAEWVTVDMGLPGKNHQFPNYCSRIYLDQQCPQPQPESPWLTIPLHKGKDEQIIKPKLGSFDPDFPVNRHFKNLTSIEIWSLASHSNPLLLCTLDCSWRHNAILSYLYIFLSMNISNLS